VLAHKEWIQNHLSAMAVFEDPQKLEELSSTQEFQDFFQDEKIQALADNQALVEHVQKGQLQKLLNDPQVTAIVRDDALMEKFMNFYYRVYKFALEEQKKQRPRE
ncbi:MAG: hypothetical protein U1D99_02625, partial [Candidatus Omnitrophota bacterium]|nr:hypothetical protein [Candidatus Omnitrophota bacterium]